MGDVLGSNLQVAKAHVLTSATLINAPPTGKIDVGHLKPGTARTQVPAAEPEDEATTLDDIMRAAARRAYALCNGNLAARRLEVDLKTVRREGVHGFVLSRMRESKMKKPSIREELLDELLGEARTQDALFGHGVLKQLTAARVERALRAEMSEHLSREKQAGLPNRRNGTSEKTLHTEHGPTPLEIPRDREARFEPQIVPKHVTRVDGLDEKIPRSTAAA